MCRHQWDNDNMADIVCRQLGYHSGEVYTFGHSSQVNDRLLSTSLAELRFHTYAARVEEEPEGGDLGHANNLFLRQWDWHSNNLLNHLLYDSLLRNHLGYVHDLLHLMRNKDVNI